MFLRYILFRYRRIIAPTLLIGMILSPVTILAGTSDEVTVTGQAPVESPNHKQTALRAAFKAAVEQVIGVQVKSETLVRDAQLINDKILARSEGFVKKWKSLREWTESGLFSIEISAQVHQGELNKSLFLNGIDVESVYDWIGRPRVLVAVSEEIDGRESATTFAQTELEGLFQAKNISVVHAPQLKAINARDVKLAFDRPDAALALGNRLGAEIVIVGKSVSSHSRDLDIAGYKQIFYSTVLEVKAYRSSNAELLMSAYYAERPGEETDTSALSKNDAAFRSIRSLVRANSQDVVYRVVKKWFEGISRGSNIQIVVAGVKGSELSAFEKYIASLPDVVNVHRRSYNRGTGELDVEFTGQQSDLVSAVEGKATLSLSLVSDEPHRITFEKEKK
jgi:hypothetical protein